MRILMLHNRYLVTGGEEESVAAEAALLRESAHDVELLELDNRDIERLGRIRSAKEALWSKASYRQVAERLEQGKADVLHAHNFFPLWSPSVYYAASRARVPVVQTLHNFRILCANASFFRQGRFCDDCLGSRWPWRGIAHACYRDSRAASSVVAGMVALHRLRGTWQERVNVYIAPSAFARDTFIAGGLPAEKIVVKPHFLHPAPPIGPGGGGYALFVGRLSQEKGVATMIKAWQTARRPLPLKVVGDGPLAGWVQEAANASGCIEYLGRRPFDDVIRLMGRAEFLVFPSECYETMGRTIMEAFAVGTPVLAAKIGPAVAMVSEGRTGFFFAAADVASLRDAVQRHSDDRAALGALRSKARAEFETQYTGPANAQRLLEIYHMAGASPTPTRQ